jgi:glyoxylase-like metal-dependent hydrolase (beta-lactamase superfamily II)
MTRIVHAIACGALLAAALAAPAQAQQPAKPPLFATTKVDGTDNVFIFRYAGHQSMFVVTPDGVIATDPIGHARPQAVTAYIAEIRKITQAPIRYVIYSHQHFDHIAGGKPFKDLGATFVAHRRAKERLEAMRYEDAVIPDDVVDDRRVISLGGTELELSFVGRNHSDSTLVMRLPKEKILFAVDFIPLRAVSSYAFHDGYPVEWDESVRKVLAMDWDRLIPGHPFAGGLGTKQHVQEFLDYMTELSAEVKKAAHAGKCWDDAEKEVRLPKYAQWANYERGIASNIRRYCGYWGRGF